MKKILFILSNCLILLSCGETSESDSPILHVVNIQNQEKYELIKPLQLDSLYPNLLNPMNVSETEMNEVSESWINFHQNMQSYLEANDFDWGVDDSIISVVNRIYFNSKGEIEYYLFGIQNDRISGNTKEAYEEILKKFSKEIKISLKRDDRFAQCGKIHYQNYTQE